MDNFLDDEYINRVENLITDFNFPWYLNKFTYETDDPSKGVQMVHLLCKDGKINSSCFDEVIVPIVEKLKINELFRAKFNLTWKTNEVSSKGFHVDGNGEGLKTTIIYFSNTNGPTIIEKDKMNIIDCVKNRALTFDVNNNHTGFTHTKGDDLRLVLNLVWK